MNHEIKISLSNIGRRFNRDWIFRGVDYDFSTGNTYAVLGPNGSGKSTLMQVLNGSLTPSAGQLNYTLDGNALEVEQVYQYLGIAAPYLELIEDFSLSEMIEFHFRFKQYLPGQEKDSLIELLGMQSSKNKQIRYFSSGMKQRLKLALAFCADTPLLMLDEPTSNLDSQGIDWYLGMVQDFAAGRMLIVCSNQEHEYGFCTHHIRITDYKS